jgi:hypothetical protein
VASPRERNKLARHLFANWHPHLWSQNRVEAAVLFQALALLERVGLAAIAVGDRGLGRKERLIRLAKRAQAFVFRIDPGITACTPAAPEGQVLALLLAARPWVGEVVWDGAGGPARRAWHRASHHPLQPQRAPSRL